MNLARRSALALLALTSIAVKLQSLLPIQPPFGAREVYVVLSCEPAGGDEKLSEHKNHAISAKPMGGMKPAAW